MSSSSDCPTDDSASSSASTDRSLLRRLRRGSQDAALQLYLRYAQRLRALAKAQCSADLARRIDTEDIVQSVFGSFFRRAREGYYDVPAGDELWKLLLVIALNKIRAQSAYHRAAKRDVRRTTAGDLVLQGLEATGTDNDAEYAFLQMVIDEALQHLPPQHRAMRELRIQGYEVAEIAQQTGRSKRTAERILQEARKKLEAALGEHHGQGAGTSQPGQQGAG
jgi:RNA polymerase sigma-70 factor (ECF subfamily)